MAEPKPEKGMRKCPICARPTAEKYRPFCSKRCADIDLNRWLKGAYAIPAAPDSDEDGDASPRIDESR
ncbi:MAG: DNA gyrase inhibitor YacG [Hyphomicrobiales bacterium]|nr:DNA gyrase inhibitor YacG [Hyphomicrobiales bacterium]